MTSAARWFYSTSFVQIRPEPEPIIVQCSYSFPGCLMPKTPHVPGAPLVSHSMCPACEPRARQEMGLKPKGAK